MTAAPPIVGTETYIAFADADALANDRLNAAEWRAAVASFEGDGIPAVCRQALITATATLDRMGWTVERAEPTQPLTWPADSIPPALATACAELAFYLLSAEGRRRRTGIQMEMIGQAMVTYFPEVADELPKHVRRLIEPFLRVRSSHSAELLP
jgi:hypothetical protein